MNATVTITRVADGLAVVFCEDLRDEDYVHLLLELDFKWSEGTMSCDCNRELDFYRRRNEPVPDFPGCTHGRFTVHVVGPDGAVIYSDGAT